MPKYTKTLLTSSYGSVAALNKNLTDIEAAIQDTVSRTGATPNVMVTDFDMDSHHILNLPAPIHPANPARLADVQQAISGLPSASMVPFSPYGEFGSVTVQGALQEASDYITGRTTVSAFDYMSSAQIADVQTRAATIDVVTAINDAISAVATAGGGFVFLPEGIYLVSTPIILKSKVYLLGEGSRNTEVKLANAADCNILEIENFATLTLSNKELISQGTPYAFGFDKLSFNGNKTNQTVAGGVALFGKRYHIGHDVMIYDTKGIAFYSECGDAGGQFEVDDMPEGYIGKLLIYKPDLEGFVYYGPHDAIIHKVSVSQAGQAGTYDGAIFSRKPGVYNGICYITGHVHCYACTGVGIRLRTAVHANILTGESCWQSGVVLDTNSAEWVGSYYSTIHTLEAYHNDQADTGTFWNVDIHGQHNAIGSVLITNNKQSLGGLHVDGNGNMIATGNILGTNATANGTGFFHEASYGVFNIKVLSFDKAGDVGFKSGTTSHSKFFITCYNCNTHWSNVGTSAYNHYAVNGYAATGSLFAQTGTFSETDTFDVKLQIGGATFGFSQYGGITSQIGAGLTSVTLNHLGFVTPKASDIHITPTMDWGANRRWVTNITATSFDVVTDAAAPGGGLSFSWRLHMN